jgi:hypothetical protein
LVKVWDRLLHTLHVMDVAALGTSGYLAQTIQKNPVRAILALLAMSVVFLAARIKQDATQFGAIVQKANIKPD